MQDNPQLLLKVLELLPLLMQQLKCSTLQTQSLRYYSRRIKINDYILLNFILFIYLLFLTGPQGQQCYTLMGFSILYKNSLLLLLLLLWPPTDPYDIQQTTKKLFQQHLVSHAFLSITFAFCGCLRLVEAFNCHSDWRQTRRNLEIPFEFLTKTENQMLHHVISTNRNEQSDLIWSDPVKSGLIHILLMPHRHVT